MYKRKSRDFYDRAADAYDREERHYRRPTSTHSIVMEKVSRIPYGSALDLGSGTGTLLGDLAPGRRLVGLDISAEMARVAQNKVRHKAHILVGDSDALPFRGGSFDLVISTYSFHHYPGPASVLKEVRRVLKPGGTLVLSDNWSFTPVRQLTNLIVRFKDEGDYHVYSEGEIRRLLERCGFSPLSWERVNDKAYIVVAERDQ